MDALGKRSRDERGGDDGEFHLKECEQGQRNRGSGDAYLRGNVFRVGHVGDADVSNMKKSAGLPMTCQMSSPKARLNPKTTHMTLTTPITIKL